MPPQDIWQRFESRRTDAHRAAAQAANPTPVSPYAHLLSALDRGELSLEEANRRLNQIPEARGLHFSKPGGPNEGHRVDSDSNSLLRGFVIPAAGVAGAGLGLNWLTGLGGAGAGVGAGATGGSAGVPAATLFQGPATFGGGVGAVGGGSAAGAAGAATGGGMWGELAKLGLGGASTLMGGRGGNESSQAMEDLLMRLAPQIEQMFTQSNRRQTATDPIYDAVLRMVMGQLPGWTREGLSVSNVPTGAGTAVPRSRIPTGMRG